MSILQHYILFPGPGQSLSVAGILDEFRSAGIIGDKVNFSSVEEMDEWGEAWKLRDKGAISPETVRTLEDASFYLGPMGVLSIQLYVKTTTRNPHIALSWSCRQSDLLPEEEQKKYEQLVFRAAYRANAAYVIEGVELQEGLPARFTEQEGKRVLSPYDHQNPGRISGISYCPGNGGAAPQGPVFLCSRELQYEGRWVVCVIEGS